MILIEMLRVGVSLKKKKKKERRPYWVEYGTKFINKHVECFCKLLFIISEKRKWLGKTVGCKKLPLSG